MLRLNRALKRQSCSSVNGNVQDTLPVGRTKMRDGMVESVSRDQFLRRT